MAGLSDMDKVSVLAALVVFRLFYLIIPLMLAVVVVLVFERSQFARTWARPLPSRYRCRPQDQRQPAPI